VTNAFAASASPWTAIFLRAASVTTSPDIAFIEKAIANGADINARDGLGMTALMRATRNGKAGLVDTLLKRGARPDDRGSLGFTALMYAAMFGHGGIVDALLDAGANPLMTDAADSTARVHAEEAGYYGIAETLAEAEKKSNRPRAGKRPKTNITAGKG
jgi:ankyrin repeat protein